MIVMQLSLQTMEIVQNENISPTRLFASGTWPLAFYADRMSYTGRVLISDGSLLHNLHASSWKTDDQVRKPFDTDHSLFEFHVFPHREMASDALRTTRTPFCGMPPFLSFVESYIHSCHQHNSSKEDNGCERFTFVEGGPHLGDCSLWTASVLRKAGTNSISNHLSFDFPK